MPKSKIKILCPECGLTFSASVFKRHVFEFAKHTNLINLVNEQKNKVISDLEKKVCVSCGEQLYIDVSKVENHILFNIVNVQNHSVIDKKYCSSKCIPVWNKGMTKDSNKSMLKISQDRLGVNNPIHKILEDPERKKSWLKNVKKSGTWQKAAERWKTGDTLEQRFGKQISDEIKIRASNRCKSDPIHKGYTHSEETKNIIRQKTIQQLLKQKNKISKPEKFFFDILQNSLFEYKLYNQYDFERYTIDIAIPELKIAIEIDGDFWHSNSEKGFVPKYDCQIRNQINDKKKNEFIIESGWDIIRIWVSDIDDNIETVIEKIKDLTCLKKTLLK